MVRKKNKRSLEYQGKWYFWYVKKNSSGIPRIHIVSEDKKVCLECLLFDTELPVTPKEIKKCLEKQKV